jgi:hypothetical protein
MCSECVANVKKFKPLCPTCRMLITSETQNFALFELLDMNLIVDPNAQLKSRINIEIDSIKQVKKNLFLKCSDKKNKVIKNMIDIKNEIENRANNFISQLMSQQDMLEKETDDICKNLHEKIDDILRKEYIGSIDIDKMEKTDLENLKEKLKEAKNKIEIDKNLLDQIDTHFYLENDQNNQYNIGRICVNGLTKK